MLYYGAVCLYVCLRQQQFKRRKITKKRKIRKYLRSQANIPIEPSPVAARLNDEWRAGSCPPGKCVH